MFKYYKYYKIKKLIKRRYLIMDQLEIEGLEFNFYPLLRIEYTINYSDTYNSKLKTMHKLYYINYYFHTAFKTIDLVMFDFNRALYMELL